VAPWITVLSRDTEFTKRVTYYKFTFCDISRNPHHIRRIVCPFLGRENRRQSGWVGISLASVRCGDFCWGLLPLLLFPPSFLNLKIVFLIASLRTWFPELLSAMRISLWASSSSFIHFFWPFFDTHNRLPCLDYYVRLGRVAEM
jgi:hypothetical protein